jgi:hypothetical protein
MDTTDPAYGEIGARSLGHLIGFMLQGALQE